MKGKLLTVTLAFALPWMVLAQEAPEGHKEVEKAVEPQVRAERQDIIAAQEAEAIQEALDAVLATQAALVALEQGKTKEALAHLEITTGKLSLLIARYPDLRMLPISSEAVVVDFQGDIQTIRKLVGEARTALEEGRVQAARTILMNLASELKIITTNLPLAVYPEALKKVAPLIDRGEIEKAKQALITALNTLVVTETIIPLPILRAQAMVEQAAKLAKEKKKEKALRFLENAKYQLQRAETLGYGEAEKDYRLLYEQIVKLEEEIQGERWSGLEALFGKLRETIKSFSRRLSEPREVEQ